MRSAAVMKWSICPLMTLLLVAWPHAQGTKPVAAPHPQTATEFYLEYRAVFDKARTLDEILPFMTAQKRQEAKAMPAMVRQFGLESLKSTKNDNNVTVLREDQTVTGATLAVEGVRPPRGKTAAAVVKGTVTLVKESGAWKIASETWR
jgi:hypothetical protein